MPLEILIMIVSCAAILILALPIFPGETQGGASSATIGVGLIFVLIAITMLMGRLEDMTTSGDTLPSLAPSKDCSIMK